MKETIIWILAILITVLFLYEIASWNCSARWKGTGITTSFGIGQGCRIHLPNGQSLPETNYRYQD